MRLFIAFTVPQNVITCVNQAQEQVKQVLRADRWQPTKNLHITLHFLGEIDEGLLPEIIRDMEMVCSIIKPFTLSLGRFGVFPEKGNPRVLWIGLKGNQEVMQQLHLLLGKRLERHQEIMIDKRSYHPHITLARGPETKEQASLPLADWSHRFLPEYHPSWKVEEIILFRSELLPTGAVHTPLHTSKLGDTTNL
ncbi:RNA 2',3'-cyclic phosphodiesterase [Brevibacillus daliensis]|uniref:RNA 2',3'-cyclic phosphodiesterase n=1 Tax=Brevibacillus daliensis TaxID=2892995 RepID=UPI001E566C03|nr:RNA 2',3'-cyclic phosphodiesterase [Brevibacillus daliensis]